MKRLMRLRASQHLRDLCAETEFNRAQLIQPFFVVEGLESEEPIRQAYQAAGGKALIGPADGSTASQ